MIRVGTLPCADTDHLWRAFDWHEQFEPILVPLPCLWVFCPSQVSWQNWMCGASTWKKVGHDSLVRVVTCAAVFGFDRSCLGRYLNHSDDPNIEFQDAWVQATLAV